MHILLCFGPQLSISYSLATFSRRLKCRLKVALQFSFKFKANFLSPILGHNDKVTHNSSEIEVVITLPDTSIVGTIVLRNL